MALTQKKYNTISYVSGPLLFVEKATDLSYGSLVNIYLPDGSIRGGQTIEISEKHAVIQVFEETRGIDIAKSSISLKEDVARLGVAREMIGRSFNGLGEPIDGLPSIIPEARQEIIGSPINPTSRAKPEEFIQTGISSIDGFNTLVRGQKLPIFSGAGLPANEIAAQIVRQAKVLGEKEEFAVVFAAMGITHREASFFLREFETTGAISKTVVFLNKADDPTIERLLTPRCALTCAEHLAYEHDYHVLVLLTDMTNYCEALREIGTAREEIPGRRGYPGYMYTDLATIYERAGRIHGRKGSITQIPILTMPDDDITHPIADLTGYITEGQLVLSRQLHRMGFYPPIDILPSLSRLMNNGIGAGHTREDHREWANQLYSSYASGRDLRKLVAIIGEEALTARDRMYLRFAQAFEEELINQGNIEQAIEDTLNLGWQLLSHLPERELKRISRDKVDKYYLLNMEDLWETEKGSGRS